VTGPGSCSGEVAEVSLSEGVTSEPQSSSCAHLWGEVVLTELARRRDPEHHSHRRKASGTWPVVKDVQE
jgi:hypothetical protein